MTAGPVDRALLDLHLPGWDYADCYEVPVDGAGPDTARTAVRCLRGSGAGRRLLRWRDRVVGVVGLQPASTSADDPFPIFVDTPELAVLGLDDAHLDFRILLIAEPGRVRCTTGVRRHNALGAAYFALVRPFHRRLVPSLLARAARRGWTPPEPSRSGPADAAAGPDRV